MKRSSPILFSKSYRIEKVIDDFLKAFYRQQMTYLASDLLDKGFEPEDILDGLTRAMKICQSGNLPVETHFIPLYSDRNGITIRDCKLSLTGYRLLLLNANPNHSATARFQLKVLEQIGNTGK